MPRPKNKFKEIALAAKSNLDVREHLHYKNYLSALANACRKMNPDFTYFDFSNVVGLSKSNVAKLIIDGQRPLTFKASQKVAIALELKGDERKYFSALVKYCNEKGVAEKEALFRKMLAIKKDTSPNQLSDLQIEYFGNWYIPVIRELLYHKDFCEDPVWIKNQLRVSVKPEDIREALKTLKKMELYRLDGDEIVVSSEEVMSGHEVDCLALISYHRQMISASLEAIVQVSELEREIQSLTLKLRRSDIVIAKHKIREILTECFAMDAQGFEEDEEVYQLNVQLFPHTSAASKNKKGDSND